MHLLIRSRIGEQMIDFLDYYIYYSFKLMGHYKKFQNTIIINAIKPNL